LPFSKKAQATKHLLFFDALFASKSSTDAHGKFFVEGHRQSPGKPGGQAAAILSVRPRKAADRATVDILSGGGDS
jgi:hypothetical protein